MLITLVAVFISVALMAGLATASVLSSASGERKRLREVTRPAHAVALPEVLPLAADGHAKDWQWAAKWLGRSAKETERLRVKLLRAGFQHPGAPVFYTLLEYVAPLAVAAAPLFLLSGTRAWIAAAGGALLAYFAPGLYVDHRLTLRRKDILNGLPDALDLLVVCIEAGCGLDQAIVKVSDELAVAYPVLADELRLMTIEIRAGKPRIEAFKSLAQRTKVDDVRALVAMLVQTDRFGTSIGQALRTHADVSRDKRRQRAEERAQKIAVKLVFPLVLCFFPAFYVVVLGPAVIQFVHTFMK